MGRVQMELAFHSLLRHYHYLCYSLLPSSPKKRKKEKAKQKTPLKRKMERTHFRAEIDRHGYSRKRVFLFLFYHFCLPGLVLTCHFSSTFKNQGYEYISHQSLGKEKMGVSERERERERGLLVEVWKNGGEITIKISKNVEINPRPLLFSISSLISSQYTEENGDMYYHISYILTKPLNFSFSH